MLSLRRCSRSASRTARPDVRPGLEELENRLTPSGAALPAATANATVTNMPTIQNVSIAESFGTFAGQMEVVTGQVEFNGVPVTSGSVTIADGDQTITAQLDSHGNFSATFNFNLFEEFSTAPAHAVNMSYSGSTVGGTTFGTTGASVSTTDETLALEYQLLTDYFVLLAVQS